MPTFRSTRRSRRHRNTKQAPEQQKAFFQSKLTMGRPGDQYEREADSVADAVVSRHHNSGKKHSPIQRLPISKVQRLATPDEEKMLQRMIAAWRKIGKFRKNLKYNV